MATTDEKQGFFAKNKNTIMVAGLIVLAGLLFVPDALIRKYVPWVK